MQAFVCATMSRPSTTAALVVPVTHSLLPRHLGLSNLPPSLTATTDTSTFRRRFFSPYNFRPGSGPVTAGLGGFNVIGDGGSMLQDAGATALVIAGAYAFVSTFDFLSERKLIEQNLSRKLVHILSGLLFMASWPIFSASGWARYFASVVPLTNCLRLVIHGLSLATDEGLIKSVTREGKPEELLRGPLYYVLVLILSAVLFWRESPVGVISLAMMCGGDGIADIVGRRFGSTKLPYNKQKSWAGSLSMFVLGFLVSVGMLYYFSALGYFQLDWVSTVERVALVSFIATMVESLPITGMVDDNISVPLVMIPVLSSSCGALMYILKWFFDAQTYHFVKVPKQKIELTSSQFNLLMNLNHLLKPPIILAGEIAIQEEINAQEKNNRQGD